MSVVLRKYTPEQIAAELARPKKKGGRPRKYATDEERHQARIEYSRRAYWRKKNAEAGIALDEQTKPLKRTYATDEERHEGIRESDRRFAAAHLEERRLNSAACMYRLRH